MLLLLLVPNLLDYYVETPLFRLFVSEQSQLRDKFDEPLEPGVYDAITGGYFVLLKDFDSDIYRIRFGGKGKGNYFTDSIYDIIVLGSGRQTPREEFLGTTTTPILSKSSSPARIPPSRTGFGI